MTSITLGPQGAPTKFTRGTGPQTIDKKVVVANPPVPSGAVLTFDRPENLSYHARLYELRDRATGNRANVAPNWFGVATPNPEDFDLSGDVYVIVYFHPMPGQAHYDDRDYPSKGSAQGTDWKQLYAYVDRLGGQMAGAIEAGAPANRVTIFPFLTSAQYTLPTSEWFNVIHDILQDINSNLVRGICTRPKKMVVATISNGSFYLNKFLADAAALPDNNKIIEVWDFDSEISTPQILAHSGGKRFRAYWQGQPPPDTATKTYIHLPVDSWRNFPRNPLPDEVPPLPPRPSNSHPLNAAGDTRDVDRIHHYIRDTMFLDAVLNIEADNT